MKQNGCQQTVSIPSYCDVIKKTTTTISKAFI